jgi:hypothetical protein
MDNVSFQIWLAGKSLVDVLDSIHALLELPSGGET